VTGDGAFGQSDGWIVARRGALLTLDHERGKLVTAEGLVALGSALNQWARDPELYAVSLGEGCLGLGTADLAPDAAAALAELCWRVECFSKPMVSLIGGDVGEVGYALALCGTHVVAGETFRLRCPSFAAGRLPPGRLMVALARPDFASRVQSFVGGATVGQNEALAHGLVAFSIPTSEFANIRAALAGADPVDPVLDARHMATATSREALDQQSAIASSFADIVRHVLADIRGREVDVALATVFRVDQVLARLGPEATIAAVREAQDVIRLDLPSRRALQAFRKS
jgi:enoyl-CoA hydratase/carnithine racemase